MGRVRAIEKGIDKSSPGLDGIDYKMLKNLSERFKREMFVFLNHAYISGKMFKNWKKNQTIFVEKKEKNKFRPITMSSCVGKILERMINERLV